MLTVRENLLETIALSGTPDRLVNQYQPFALVMNDPLRVFTTKHRVRGTTSRDLWGTTIVWPEDQYAPMPHVTPTAKVLPDIVNWRSYVRVLDLAGNCGPGAEWAPSLAAGEAARSGGRLVTGFMSTGIIEQVHFLMGFEDALVGFLAEPESMKALLGTILEYRMTYARLLIEYMKPEGVLPQNDIAGIRKRTGNRLTLMGGIDAAVEDRADATETEIRVEVRRACEAYGADGHFITCLTYGGPGSIHSLVDPPIGDEIDRFNAERSRQ